MSTFSNAFLLSKLRRANAERDATYCAAWSISFIGSSPLVRPESIARQFERDLLAQVCRFHRWAGHELLAILVFDSCIKDLIELDRKSPGNPVLQHRLRVLTRLHRNLIRRRWYR